MVAIVSEQLTCEGAFSFVIYVRYVVLVSVFLILEIKSEAQRCQLMCLR